jgi:dienelactone hydrolase
LYYKLSLGDDFLKYNLSDEAKIFNYDYEGWDENSGKATVLKDKRILDVKHINFQYRPVIYTDKDRWEKRKTRLEQQILISSGLWPLPEKSALNAKIYDKIIFDDFSVEKVVFESFPGFFVTGNLYRPLEKKGPFPAILNPHGHWDNGRLEHSEKSDIPTRCANFAKMGFVAFAYDMLGFQDSIQANHLYGGFIQELWCAGAFGIQLWNSIRSIDFLETLPDVDSDKIGCTGASGGGTQTFFLSAIDKRIKAAVPVNMISAHMQGGCNCEDSPGLRIDTNNVEIAAMTAPTPMLIISCTGDWTKNTPNVEFPAIHSVYDLYGKGHEIEYFYQEADHNYNKQSRERAYNWFARKLQNADSIWHEKEIDFGDVTKFKIYADGAKPEGIKNNVELFEFQKKERINILEDMWRKDESRTSCIMETSMRHVLGIFEEPGNEMEERYNSCKKVDDLNIKKVIISSKNQGEEIPVVTISKDKKSNGKTILFIHPKGKNAILEDEEWESALDNELSDGYTIASADLFLTGEYHSAGSNSGRDMSTSIHFTTFNYTDTALRIQDIVKVCKYIKSQDTNEIIVCGLKEAGMWCIAALPFITQIKCGLIDLSKYNPDSVKLYLDKFFIPGFLSAGGFKTSLRLSQSTKLQLFNVKNEKNLDFIKNISSQKNDGSLIKIIEKLPVFD